MYTELRAVFEDVKNLAVGIRDKELHSKIIELYGMSMELMGENSDLKEKLKAKETKDNFLETHDYKPSFGAYVKKDNEKIFVCSRCFDAEEKTIKMQPVLYSYSDTVYYKCPNCKMEVFSNNRYEDM